MFADEQHSSHSSSESINESDVPGYELGPIYDTPVRIAYDEDMDGSLGQEYEKLFRRTQKIANRKKAISDAKLEAELCKKEAEEKVKEDINKEE